MFELYKEIDSETYAQKIKLQCLSPKVAFSSLCNEFPKNMFFTSGTLDDLNFFKKYTGIRFHPDTKRENFKL